MWLRTPLLVRIHHHTSQNNEAIIKLVDESTNYLTQYVNIMLDLMLN